MLNLSDFKFIYYQDKYFYYFWKPAGIASTWGKSVSFLDYMCDDKNNKEIKNIVESQLSFFGKEKELGLLNRLDNATSGLLYFAKNFKIYTKFRELQQNLKINKYYLVQVYGNIQKWIDENRNLISYPIMHHKFSEDRMIVIKSELDQKKGKGRLHDVSTEIVEVDYNEKDNISTIIVKIHKGIRHQIRAHLSSIVYPICGDEIYCKSKSQTFDKLQLFSIGMNIEM